MAAERRGEHFILNGTKLFVGDAVAATHLIVAVRTGSGAEALSLLVVDKQATGVAARNLPGLLSWQAEVTFDGVEIGGGRVAGRT